MLGVQLELEMWVYWRNWLQMCVLWVASQGGCGCTGETGSRCGCTVRVVCLPVVWVYSACGVFASRGGYVCTVRVVCLPVAGDVGVQCVSCVCQSCGCTVRVVCLPVVVGVQCVSCVCQSWGMCVYSACGVFASRGGCVCVQCVWCVCQSRELEMSVYWHNW